MLGHAVPISKDRSINRIRVLTGLEQGLPSGIVRLKGEDAVVEGPNQEGGHPRGGDALHGLLKARERKDQDAAEEGVVCGGVVLEVELHLWRGDRGVGCQSSFQYVIARHTQI